MEHIGSFFCWSLQAREGNACEAPLYSSWMWEVWCIPTLKPPPCRVHPLFLDIKVSPPRDSSLDSLIVRLFQPSYSPHHPAHAQETQHPCHATCSRRELASPYSTYPMPVLLTSSFLPTTPYFREIQGYMNWSLLELMSNQGKRYLSFLADVLYFTRASLGTPLTQLWEDENMPLQDGSYFPFFRNTNNPLKINNPKVTRIEERRILESAGIGEES